jgi:hypothetical protein
VALCAANKTGRPLPGEMLLRDRLPTFHFRLSFLLSLLSIVRIIFIQKTNVQLASIVPHTLLSNLKVFTNLHVNIVFAVPRKDTENIKDRTE